MRAANQIARYVQFLPMVELNASLLLHVPGQAARFVGRADAERVPIQCQGLSRAVVSSQGRTAHRRDRTVHRPGRTQAASAQEERTAGFRPRPAQLAAEVPSSACSRGSDSSRKTWRLPPISTRITGTSICPETLMTSLRWG